MGCGPSKIDQEETVAMCKDRKRFIREAVAARNGLAAAHSAYAASLKNTGAALSDYAQGESLATSDIQRVQNNLAITSSARRAVADTPADSIYPPPPPDAPGEGSETLAPLRLMSSAALVEMARNKGKAPMYASVTQEEDSRDYGNVDEIVAPRSVPSALPPPPPPPPPPPRKKGKVVSLLQVLNELDKDFLKASASAHNVLKSLEAVRMHYHSNFADNRGYIDHSARVLEVITWNRSPKDDTENEETEEEFDKDHEWDTHATVLDKIAALEKKLYDEVKEVEIMKMAYTDKLESLNKKKRRGAGSKSIERTRSFASHLHTKYVVAMQTMESTLSEIDRLRDSQLYPKLVELVEGLGRMWEAMCEHHSKQRKTISVLKHWEVVGMVKQTTEQHHDRTVQLFQIVQEWHAQFHKLTSYQRGYVHSLTNWLLLNLVPIDTDVRKKPQQHQEPDTPIQEPEVSDEQQEPLPIEMLLRGWSACLEQLQHEVAGTSIVTFAEAIRSIIMLQDEELKLKQSCEMLHKELEKRERQFEDWGRKYMERMNSRPQSENPAGSGRGPLEERRASLEALRERLADEEMKHSEQCKLVREKSLVCFQTNLADVFRALLEFSLSSSIMYKNLFATTQPMDEEDQ